MFLCSYSFLVFTSLDPDLHENLCGSETLSWIPVSCRQAGGNGMPRFIFNVVYHQQVRYIGRYDSLRQVISVISTFLPNGWNWITVWDVGFLDSELLHRQFGVRTATLFSIEISGWNSDRNHYVRRAIIGFSVLHTLVPCMNVSQMVIF